MPKDVLDPELKTGIKQALKKPRNYAIIAKGPKVVKLIVQKTKIKDGDLMNAKSEFKGDNIIAGVCLPEGPDLVFQVLDKEPTIKTTAFKDFIDEQTGKKVKPRFSVVKALSEVKEDEKDDDLDDDSEDGEVEGVTQPTIGKESTSGESTSDPSVESVLEDLLSKMNQMAPLVKDAVVKSPTQRGELTKLVSEFQTQVKAKNADPAREALLALGKLVKSILTGSTSTTQSGGGQSGGGQSGQGTSGPQTTPPTQPQPTTTPPKQSPREQKEYELTNREKNYTTILGMYENMPGAVKGGPAATKLAQWKQELVKARQIKDDTAAIQELDRVSEQGRLNTAEINKQIGLLKAAQNVSELETANTVPEYAGKNPFKDTGKKEFEQTITQPVAALLKAIQGPVKAGTPMSEKDYTELVRLRTLLKEKEKEYATKAAEVNKEKHPQTAKLLTDYSAKCKSLSGQLQQIQIANVTPDLDNFRVAKRPVDAALDALDKRVALMKRLDPEAHKLHAQVAADKRKGVQKIADDHVPPTNTPQKIKELNNALEDIKRTTEGIFASKESNNLLDNAVKKIGREAKSKEDQEFMQEAMRARFNIDIFKGDLTGSSLVALYNVFNLVPDSHTKTNKWLTKLKREMSLDDVESFYSAPDKEKAKQPKGTIAIKAMRSKGPIAMVQNNLMGPLLLKNVVGNKKVDQFSWVTLHEIGHAVDHSDDYMVNNQKKLGDWKEHTPTEIEKMVVDALQKAHPKYPRRFLRSYLGVITSGDDPAKSNIPEGQLAFAKQLQGANIGKDELLGDDLIKWAEEQRLKFEDEGWDKFTDELLNGLSRRSTFNDLLKKQIAADAAKECLKQHRPMADVVEDIVADGQRKDKMEEAKPDYEALKKTPILSWYKSAVLKELPGVFAGIKQMVGTANWIRAAEHPFGSRIYHESYSGTWVSYDKSLRDTRVSDYQLRAPGEYFAEGYAAFFLDKLPKSSPLYDDLVELKKKKELAN